MQYAELHQMTTGWMLSFGSDPYNFGILTRAIISNRECVVKWIQTYYQLTPADYTAVHPILMQNVIKYAYCTLTDSCKCDNYNGPDVKNIKRIIKQHVSVLNTDTAVVKHHCAALKGVPNINYTVLKYIDNCLSSRVRCSVM